MPEGVFHDAHEVYGKPTVGDADWVWVATFATKKWAEEYVWQKDGQQRFAAVPVEFEVRAV